MGDLENVFKPIRSRKTFEEVLGEIKRLIFAGTLKPGDRLPAELELASQFGVARQTVREALRVLELSGFIHVQQGGGGRIIKNTVSDSISNSFIDAIQMNSVSVAELTAARLEIEKITLTYAVQNADDSDIRLLSENIAQAKEKIRRGSQAFDENVQFHRILARAAKNKVFEIVLQALMLVVSDFLSKREPNIHSSNEVIDIHETIFQAIVSRNTKYALALLENHIIDVGERL